MEDYKTNTNTRDVLIDTNAARLRGEGKDPKSAKKQSVREVDSVLKQQRKKK